jgi:hypothetical protein
MYCACIHFDLEFDLLHGRDGMFMLEVKVEGFASKDLSGRKSYMKGHVFKWDVEFGSMTFDLLLKSLATELNLSTDQIPTVWFYDKNLKEDARLVDEIDMVDFVHVEAEVDVADPLEVHVLHDPENSCFHHFLQENS